MTSALGRSGSRGVKREFGEQSVRGKAALPDPAEWMTLRLSLGVATMPCQMANEIDDLGGLWDGDGDADGNADGDADGVADGDVVALWPGRGCTAQRTHGRNMPTADVTQRRSR